MKMESQMQKCITHKAQHYYQNHTQDLARSNVGGEGGKAGALLHWLGSASPSTLSATTPHKLDVV